MSLRFYLVIFVLPISKQKKKSMFVNILPKVRRKFLLLKISPCFSLSKHRLLNKSALARSWGGVILFLAGVWCHGLLTKKATPGVT